jgi:hypothetical protein
MDIETKLKYLEWQPSYNHTRPYRIAQFGRKRKNQDENKPHNLVFREGDAAETIRDIRGINEGEKHHGFTLETNGFVYRRYPPLLFANPKDFETPEHIQNVFLPNCEAILKNEIEEVDQVFIFDWKVGVSEGAWKSKFDLLLLSFYLLISTDKEKEKRKRAAKEKPEFIELRAPSTYR